MITVLIKNKKFHYFQDHNKEYTAYISSVNQLLQDRGMRTAKVLANKFSPQKGLSVCVLFLISII